MTTTDTTQQQPQMTPAPAKQHQWLQKLVGEWTYEGSGTDLSNNETHKSSGTERVRAIGELWIMAESEGTMPGGEASQSLMTLGFDTAMNRFVGTWVGSMMTNMWIYDGELDEAGKVLTLHTVGPSMADDGTLAKYKEVIEIGSDDHRVFASNVLGDDGKWTQFMTTHYRRK